MQLPQCDPGDPGVFALALGLLSKEHAVVIPALVFACAVSLGVLDRRPSREGGAPPRPPLRGTAGALLLVQGLLVLGYVAWWRPRVLGGVTTGAPPIGGSAETQLVISTIPGIDPAFAYIPRTTTTRLVSKSVTTVAGDGSLLILIENTGAAGEIYAPTRTALRGTRTGPPRIAKGGASDVTATPVKAED